MVREKRDDDGPRKGVWAPGNSLRVRPSHMSSFVNRFRCAVFFTTTFRTASTVTGNGAALGSWDEGGTICSDCSGLNNTSGYNNIRGCCLIGKFVSSPSYRLFSSVRDVAELEEDAGRCSGLNPLSLTDMGKIAR